MSPVFDSTKQAAAFAGLLLGLLLLPALVGKSGLPSREQAYQTENRGSGPYPWIHRAIFEEKGDIDVAFVGSSHLFHGVDAPYVQEELSKKLTRPAVVRTIGWGGAGYDALYFLAKDLLENRRVRCLVFYDEYNLKNRRNVQGTTWFRWRENAADLAGLPLVEKGRFYLTALLGMPRNLLALIRPNLPADLSPAKLHDQEAMQHAPDPSTRLGSSLAEEGFSKDPDVRNYASFAPFTPHNGVTPDDVLTYSEATKNSFQFSNDPLPAWQAHFVRKLVVLAQDHGTRLIFLHIPTTSEVRIPAIQERVCWPEFLHADMAMVGIPPKKFFQNLTEAEILMLFTDWSHLNKNGAEYFTRLITPTLLKIYVTEGRP